MHRAHTTLMILMRMAVGWLLLWQGISGFLAPSRWVLPDVVNPGTAVQFYALFNTPSTFTMLALTLKVLFVIAGLFLLIGIFVRTGALIGIALMLFYYLPSLRFPYVTTGGVQYYIVDPQLVIAIVLLYISASKVGEFFGLRNIFRSSHE